jgi:hypothetical protein
MGGGRQTRHSKLDLGPITTEGIHKTSDALEKLAIWYGLEAVYEA